MAQETNLTFEQVNDHVEKTFNDAQAMTSATAASTATTICSVYGVVRPILLFVKKFVPAKWGKAIDAFIAALDVMCPQQKSS